MTGLLEFREKLKLIYSKNEMFIVPVIKFLLTFIVLNMINSHLGYMSRLDNIIVVLIVSLLCSFLPNGCIILFAAVFSLLHLYELSMEVALVGLCVYLVMFLLFIRLSPKDSMTVLLTPVLFALNVPYIMPIVMGLLGSPVSAISVGCGVVVYYFLNSVVSNAAALNSMGSEEAAAKLRMAIDGLLNNKAMIVIILAFAITVLVVYLIRRMSVEYSWTIAIVAGAIFNLIILLIGDFLYDTNISVFGAVLGSLLAVAAGKVVQFFRFFVDYSRTEKVQFEDDEYYYYVKAVPKMMVATPTKTVKKINNTQRKPGSQETRNTAEAGSRRRVETERTYASRGGKPQEAARGPRSYRKDSVTINSDMEDLTDDYEDLD